VPEEQLSGLGELDGPRTARPLDEGITDDLLERRDLLADGRLRISEPIRSASERPLARDCIERREVPNLDPEPMIRLSDRTHEYLDLT
jgi:hypothetical protein